ncbi:MAG: DUF4065 domain-containing protein [Candidatus Taylorbacteria bacterium]|nr:DUF4065 domain-containing protein [Candidatus Taylorbacteria bacterium]
MYMQPMTSQKPINALMVADYILLKAKQEGKPITNKKLQKLLYYTQAWSAALQNKKLFDDRIEAWIHGPAVKSVYLAYKEFGAEPIVKNVTSEMVKGLPKEATSIIDQVWSIYSKYDAPYLEYLTHSEEPWQKARQGLEPHIVSENEITFESMRNFYKQKLAPSS